MIRPKVACGSVKIGSYAAGGQIPYGEEQFYCCRACETAQIGNQKFHLIIWGRAKAMQGAYVQHECCRVLCMAERTIITGYIYCYP